MSAIRGAVSEEPAWECEPPTSLQVDIKPDALLDDLPHEMINPLPTIQSIPELDIDADFSTVGEIQVGSTSYPRRSGYGMDYAARIDIPGLPPSSSRRSSVASFRVGPILSTEPCAFHLVRSTATAREQVDRWLLDVFSEQCLTARLRAHTNEEDLFEAQKVTHSFSRSSSGLTMASAMSVAAKNRLTKRESVLVPRRTSFIETGNYSSDAEGQASAFNPLRPGGKRRHPKRLKILAMPKLASSEGDEDANEVFLDSPSPISYCSTASVTMPVTPLNLPGPLSAQLPCLDHSVMRPESLNARQEGCVPKRSRSMIENVRFLFSSRSSSPNSLLAREPSVGGGASSPSLLRWWSRGSLRQRARSAPDVPANELSTSQSLSTPEPQGTILLAERPYSQPDLKCFHSFSPHTRTIEHVRHSSVEVDVSPVRAKTMFSVRARMTVSMSPKVGRRDEEGGTGVVRVRRNMSFLQRFTPLGMPSSPVAS